MSIVILTKFADGSPCVIAPSFTCGIPVEEIARKDGPEGQPYAIVDSSVLPKDPEYFGSWKFDFPEGSPVCIGPNNWWQELLGRDEPWMEGFARKYENKTTVREWVKAHAVRSMNNGDN